MWSRVVEVMLGFWLLASPFIFQHSTAQTALWFNDLLAGTAVIVFSLLSYWHPTRHAHLLIMIVSAWLISFAYFRASTGESVPPALQNSAILGLLLLMFSVIPNNSSQPPTTWSSPPK